MNRAEQVGTMVGVRLQPDQLAKLEAWIAHQPNPQPSRPEAGRRILEARLVHEEERGRLRPSDLTISLQRKGTRLSTFSVTVASHSYAQRRIVLSSWGWPNRSWAALALAEPVRNWLCSTEGDGELLKAGRTVLEAAGVTFTNADEPGVRLKRSPE